jgi:hypothetical protein
MGDNLRRYRVIRNALTQCHPGELRGHVARCLMTLVALSSGIVATKRAFPPTSRNRPSRGPRPRGTVGWKYGARNRRQRVSDLHPFGCVRVGSAITRPIPPQSRT